MSNVKYLAELSKFVVFFNATDDPELLDILTDAVARQFRFIPVDDILTILVNFAHTLSPNAQELFDVANQEFGQRMRTEVENLDPALVWRPEDLIKAMTVLLEHRQMKGELKEHVIENLQQYQSEYTYETRAELAILFATKMDERYRDMYFSKFLDKFVKDAPYLDEDTLYKILWAFIKANRLVVREDAYEWLQVRQVLQ